MSEQFPRLISYAICDGAFLAIQQHVTYFSLYVVDRQPEDLSLKTVSEFLCNNQHLGSSVSGSWEQIIDELESLLNVWEQEPTFVNITYGERQADSFAERIEAAIIRAANTPMHDKPVVSPER